MLSVDELASMIDHSIIDPNHTEDDMRAGIELAQYYRVGRFTTQPFRVKTAKALLAGTEVALQTYVGFAHGNDVTAVKVLQAKHALDDGIDELDMVVNLSALLSGDMRLVQDDIRQVVEVAAPYGVKVKAIIEVYFLTDAQKRAVAIAAEEAGAAFIKTSTGTRPDRQESVAADIGMLRAILKPETVIKASGGVYDLDAVLAYYDAGARRFGASETAAILEDLRTRIAEGVLVT